VTRNTKVKSSARSALECGSEAAALEFRQNGASFAAALQGAFGGAESTSNSC
jgi:hypothetical protein